MKWWNRWNPVPRILSVSILVVCASACCTRHVAKYFVDPRRGRSAVAGRAARGVERRWMEPAGLHKYVLLTLICLFIPGPYFHDAWCFTGVQVLLARVSDWHWKGDGILGDLQQLLAAMKFELRNGILQDYQPDQQEQHVYQNWFRGDFDRNP